MNVDTPPGEREFVFFAEALPKDGLHRVSIAAGGLDTGIPSAVIATGIKNALRVCGGLNRRLRYYRPSSAAFACRRRGAVVAAAPAGIPPADPALAIGGRPTCLPPFLASFMEAEFLRVPGERPEEQREKGSPVPGAITEGG